VSPTTIDGMHSAERRLLPFARILRDQRPRGLWELDTSTLPRPLQRYRRELRAFAERELAPRRLRADVDPDGWDKMDLLRTAARAGVLTGWMPRPIGTGGAWTLRHPLLLVAALRIEELCAVCGGLGLLLGANELGLLPLLIGGDLTAAARFLVPAVRKTKRGEPSLFAFAITEPDAGSDVQDTQGATSARIVTRAKRVPGGWSLRGRKCFISNGDVADQVTVMAALEGEGLESWTCFLVDKGRPGFAVGRHEKKLGQRAAAAVELVFDDVFVPADRVIGPLRGGWALARATLDASRGPVGAIAVGIARSAFDAALEYAQRTVVAGRPLVEHDDVKMALADMLMELTAARACIWHAARFFPPRGEMAAIAKGFGAESSWRVCTRAMELMGDGAMLHANRAEKALRDVRLNQIYEGTDQITRLALVEAQWERSLARADARAASPEVTVMTESASTRLYQSAGPRTTRRTAAGPVDLPILYFDASVVNVAVRVPIGPVAELLSGREVVPVAVRGKATLVLTVFEYRDTTVGRYNELSVGIVARPRWDTRLAATGIWVQQLPVTTELARAAGREIWGYPKWVTPIEWSQDARAIRAGLPGELHIEVARSTWPAPTIRMPMTTYTELGGKLVKTVLRTRSPLHVVRGARTWLVLAGSGQVSDLLQRLGAERVRPAFGLYSERFTSILPEGDLVAGPGARRTDVGSEQRAAAGEVSVP
jgi:alkylation response protein AidB-like acyl-CoA dehydrogenase